MEANLAWLLQDESKAMLSVEELRKQLPTGPKTHADLKRMVDNLQNSKKSTRSRTSRASTPISVVLPPSNPSRTRQPSSSNNKQAPVLPARPLLLDVTRDSFEKMPLKELGILMKASITGQPLPPDYEQRKRDLNFTNYDVNDPDYWNLVDASNETSELLNKTQVNSWFPPLEIEGVSAGNRGGDIIADEGRVEEERGMEERDMEERDMEELCGVEELYAVEGEELFLTKEWV